MAQVQQVLLTCDVCGGDKPGQETVPFAAEGKAYEIDLCDKHAKQLRDAVAPFADKGRRASNRAADSGRRAKASGHGDRQRTQEIRAWARSKGIKVSERGRMSADVVRQYEAANR